MPYQDDKNTKNGQNDKTGNGENKMKSAFRSSGKKKAPKYLDFQKDVRDNSENTKKYPSYTYTTIKMPQDDKSGKDKGEGKSKKHVGFKDPVRTEIPENNDPSKDKNGCPYMTVEILRQLQKNKKQQ
ncbi:hypothetical protein NPX13_g8331 [Xylaria arbuscula]|uniref:Uncharacterized protein n=1 Tax=Xylaria arbuscula TaxID=114810 RepID=A0A9W8N8V6_9PEZI|nr:hypothetical protein NPX13_g8331 [Xylaria arbuscula]